MNMPRPERMLESHLASEYDLQAYQLVIDHPTLISRDTLMDLAGLYNRLCPSLGGHAQNLWNTIRKSLYDEN